MKKVLGIGNALVDVLMQLDDDNVLEKFNLPKGSMQLVEADIANKVEDGTSHLKRELASGGSASNTINGLANMGIKCGYIGKIGDDDLGKLFSDDLKKKNIEDHLLKSSADSGRAITFISKDAERTFATYLGAAVELSADDLTPEMFEGYDFLHIEGYLVFNEALIAKALKLAKDKGMRISIDMASYNVVEAKYTFLKESIKDYVDIVFANEEESKALTNKAPEEALEEIANDCEIAVVKIGKNGSLIKSNGQVFKVDAINATSKDTTGAGDLYAAGFIYGLSKGLTLEQCGKIGAILGGNVIEVIGAKMDDERWSKVKKMISDVEGK